MYQFPIVRLFDPALSDVSNDSDSTVQDAKTVVRLEYGNHHFFTFSLQNINLVLV